MKTQTAAHEAPTGIHARYLSRLTGEWQALSALKFGPTDGARGYDDLVTWGYAEVRRTPIHRQGILCGETTEFRLARCRASFEHSQACCFDVVYTDVPAGAAFITLPIYRCCRCGVEVRHA